MREVSIPLNRVFYVTKFEKYKRIIRLYVSIPLNRVFYVTTILFK